jgi:hypothetical protein
LDRGLKLVTGNRLRDGAVVYYAGGGAWTRQIGEARLVDEANGSALLADAQIAPPPHPAVGPALIDVLRDGECVVPASLRERIRAAGPTVAYRGG